MQINHDAGWSLAQALRKPVVGMRKTGYDGSTCVHAVLLMYTSTNSDSKQIVYCHQ